ncbi:hypothetical protein MRX96_055922 [Rhipicephalus microplus]
MDQVLPNDDADYKNAALHLPSVPANVMVHFERTVQDEAGLATSRAHFYHLKYELTTSRFGKWRPPSTFRAFSVIKAVVIGDFLPEIDRTSRLNALHGPHPRNYAFEDTRRILGKKLNTGNSPACPPCTAKRKWRQGSLISVARRSCRNGGRCQN